VVRHAAESPEGLAESLDRKIAEMGWTGLLIPAAHGGLGLGVLDAALLLVELGRHAAPGAFLFSAVLATTAIVRSADRRAKQRWLPSLASGERSATLAWLEKDARLDPAGIQCRARRSGSRFRLRGTKCFVPYADAVDWLIVAARTSGKDAAGGVSLF